MASLDLLFANNAESTLAIPCSAIDVSFTVQAADAAKFPSPTGGRIFKATLMKVNTKQKEIVHVNLRVGAECFMLRAQEGTAALAFVAGDIAALRPTAGILDASKHTYYDYTPGMFGTTAATKVATLVTVLGDNATIFLAAHGYANGNTVYHTEDGAWPHVNLTGCFQISNVTANTYDIVMRKDRANSVPASGVVAATVALCGNCTFAVGRYRIEDNQVEFWMRLLYTAITNITGNVQLILPVPPAATPANLLTAIDVNDYAGITHLGKIVVQIAQNALLRQSLIHNVGSTLVPAVFGAAGFTATPELHIHGCYLI